MVRCIRPYFMLLSLLASIAVKASPVNAFFCSYFNYELGPSQVVPPTQVSGTGGSELFLCDDDSLRGYINVNVPEKVTAVHIHGPAEPGENGDLLYELPFPISEEYVPVLLGPIPDDQKIWFGLEQCYVDVHTVTHPDGAIRGQIHAEIAVTATSWATVKRLFR